MEVPQGMELTRTNRSGGLTTFFSTTARSRVRWQRHAELFPCGAGATQAPTLATEARREKVKAITQMR